MFRLRSAILDQPQLLAVLAAACYWCAFPPVKLPILAWIVPVLWTALIRQEIAGGRVSFYATLWLAGALFWLATLSWLCLPIWWLQALWVISAFLLAAFWPVFVAISRAAVHGFGCPVIIAVPVVWCGLEWFRKNWLAGGFSLASIEHTQYENLTLIQSADLFGEHGVGLFIVLLGAGIGRLLPVTEPSAVRRATIARGLDSRLIAASACLCAVGFVVAYGRARLAQVSERAIVGKSKAKVALLQGNIDATLLSPPSLAQARVAQYEELSRRAGPLADLVVWPEDALGLSLTDFPSDFVPEAWKGQPSEAIEEMLRMTRSANRKPFVDLAAEAGASLLLNTDVTWYDQIAGRISITHYNSALLVDPQGNIGPRHDKTRLVPLLEGAPRIENLVGEGTRQPPPSPGKRIVAFPIRVRDGGGDDALWAAVNICYEAFFPHFVRRQVRTLAAEGRNPDVLINLSNDASFDFPGVAEMNLAIHVFRAVENRRPYLTATHAGYAAWIEPTGRIVERGKHGAATFVVAEIGREKTASLYTYWGDWVPFVCMCLTVLVSVPWLLRREARRWGFRSA